MIKIDREALIRAIGSATGEVAITLTGQLSDGRMLIGTDLVRVMAPPASKK